MSTNQVNNRAIEDAARNILRARGAHAITSDDGWQYEVDRYRSMCEKDPRYADGGNLVSNAFRDARAALTASPPADLPFRPDDIRRGLILFRTSNNAHGYTNFEALTAKIDALHPAAKEELATTMRNFADGLCPAAAMDVMPLKWFEVGTNLGISHAPAIVGYYRVLGQRPGVWEVLLDTDRPFAVCDTEEGAKAAAQADYDRRVRSALAAPQQRPDGRLVDEIEAETSSPSSQSFDPPAVNVLSVIADAMGESWQRADGETRDVGSMCAYLAGQIRTHTPSSHMVGIPAGWKLVPIKPTEDMLDAALGVHESRDGEDEEFFAEFRRTYRAMVKAAPDAPAAQPAPAELLVGETFTREQMLAEVERRVDRALAAREALAPAPGTATEGSGE